MTNPIYFEGSEYIVTTRGVIRADSLVPSADLHANQG